jgi:glycosyltransferase involved in cell wall biosynthesis
MHFSVIVPTYNEAEYIEKCLLSILGQNIEREDYEIIVSDAASTDRTAEIAGRFADMVVISKERGIAIGRNRGAEKAKGDILVFVDADAALSKDFLSRCRDTFENPEIAGMTGIAEPCGGGFLQRLVLKCTFLLVRFFNFAGISLFPGICVAYKSRIFFEIKGFREDFGIVEDLDLSRRISRRGKCVVNNNAGAVVSTRRLEKNLVSTVLFHIYSDMKYLLTGKAALLYPKTEEIHSWHDLWRQKQNMKNGIN